MAGLVSPLLFCSVLQRGPVRRDPWRLLLGWAPCCVDAATCATTAGGSFIHGLQEQEKLFPRSEGVTDKLVRES